MTRFPTVREMGRLALPLGTLLVAGELGVERTTRWARTGGALSPLFPILNAEEVALLDLPVVQSSNPSLTPARVVRELSRLRVAAIVVKGEVDPPTLREADRTNTPLYILPDNTEIPRVSRSIIRLLSDRETQEEAQASALYRLLSQQVVAENGLRYLVQTLHEVTGHAVSVTTPTGDLLAGSGNYPAGAVARTAPIVVGDMVIAHLTLADSPARVDTFTEIALEQGAAALALELAKLEAIEAVRSGVQLEFLTALLRNEPEHVLVARARAAEFTLESFHWLLLGVAEERNEINTWLRRATRYAEDAGWSVRSTLTVETISPYVNLTQGTLVLSGGGEWSRPHATLINTLRETWSGQSPLSLAVGDPAYGLGGIQKSLEEARGALTLGIRLLGVGRNYLHREMGLYRLLRHLQGTEDLTHFLHRTLGALEAYDREHNAELVDSLIVLLEQGGNVSAAAKAMHLHRNSLIYRVERIRDIAGLDPTNAEDGFTLRLALMLAPLR
jgi:PucR family transcriptional regulator, purine catabolism regulatory protein